MVAVTPWAATRQLTGLPINDVLYLVRREHARPLFDHLEMVLRKVGARGSHSARLATALRPHSPLTACDCVWLRWARGSG